MKYIYILFVVLSIGRETAVAQNLDKDLVFNSNVLEALDKWVAMPMEKDSTYKYGFIYLDNAAGLTFNLEGSFKIDNKGLLIPKKLQNSMFKNRLSPSALKVAILPLNKYKELEVEEFPEWYKIYTPDKRSIERLFRLGNTNNHWNNSANALPYLEAVKEINSNYRGLAYELSFSYNALKQYDKATNIVLEALKLDPKNCELYKELLYAQMNLKQTDKAMEYSKLALDVCVEKKFRYQMLRDLLYHYFTKKDKDQFKVWAEKAKIEMATVPGALQGIAKWEAEINK